MGGGRRFEYPKWVWSPAGGWWANPVHWRRNSVLYLVGASMVAYAAYTYAEPRTIVYEPKLPTSNSSHGHDSHH